MALFNNAKSCEQADFARSTFTLSAIKRRLGWMFPCSATLKMPTSRAVSVADGRNAASRRPHVGSGGTVPTVRSPI
jgi:hypothetical protein